MVLSNFELNSYKQSSGDKSAIGTNNLKDVSLKQPAKKIRAANVNRSDGKDEEYSLTDQSGRIVTTKPA